MRTSALELLHSSFWSPFGSTGCQVTFFSCITCHRYNCPQWKEGTGTQLGPVAHSPVGYSTMWWSCPKIMCYGNFHPDWLLLVWHFQCLALRRGLTTVPWLVSNLCLQNAIVPASQVLWLQLSSTAPDSPEFPRSVGQNSHEGETAVVSEVPKKHLWSNSEEATGFWVSETVFPPAAQPWYNNKQEGKPHSEGFWNGKWFCWAQMPKAINNSNLIVKTDAIVKFSGKLNRIIISREARTMFLENEWLYFLEAGHSTLTELCPGRGLILKKMENSALTFKNIMGKEKGVRTQSLGADNNPKMRLLNII